MTRLIVSETTTYVYDLAIESDSGETQSVMISRAAAIERLADLAGPLGPFVSPVERETERGAWLAQLSAEDIAVLLDIAAFPPEPVHYRPASWDQFELELVESIAAAGKSDPRRFFMSIAPLLAGGQALPIVIDVIGQLGVPEGISVLESLMQSSSLTTDELVRLACSAGDIGTPEAAELLNRMRSLPGASHPDVQSELEIAAGRIEQRQQ